MGPGPVGLLLRWMSTTRFSISWWATISAAQSLIEGAVVSLIDMPIGIVGNGPDERRADSAARHYLGKRRSSVFPMPCRAALAETDYLSASLLNQKLSGRKLSKQTWNIMPKIAEVDGLVRANRALALRESHPEVCFTALHGGAPMAHNKKTPAGYGERLDVLKAHLPEIVRAYANIRAMHLKKALADDDILDAMVLALTARTGSRAGFRSLPEHAQYDGYGLPMEIVYAD